MKRPAFESTKLPISWKRWQYTTGRHEMIDINPPVLLPNGEEINAMDLLQELCAQDSVLNQDLWQGKPFEFTTMIKHFLLNEPFSSEFVKNHADFVAIKEKFIPQCIPANVAYITVDKEAVRNSGMMIPNDSIPDRMELSLEGRNDISKSELMMLEVIAQNNFKRPLYMSTTVGPGNYGSLYRHFIQEGLAHRISPFIFEENQPMVFTKVDTEKMYDNMMNKYSYGNLKQEGLYLDETTMRMCYTHRRWFSMLISALIDEGKTEMAMKALEKVSTEIPAYNVPHDSGSGSIDLAQAYIRCGQLDKAEEILNALKDKSKEYAYWYIGLSSTRFVASMRECRQDISILSIISDMFGDMAKVQEDKAEHYNNLAAECMQHAESLSQAFFSKAQSAGVDF